jgi:hypothetical protein
MNLQLRAIETANLEQRLARVEKLLASGASILRPVQAEEDLENNREMKPKHLDTKK